MDYKISPHAEAGLENILDYLRYNFGNRFHDSYYLDFQSTIYLTTKMPELFPIASDDSGLRKMVFRKRTTMYYTVGSIIEIIAIIDNRQDFTLA